MSGDVSRPTWRRKTEAERRAGHPRSLRSRLNPEGPLLAGAVFGVLALLVVLFASVEANLGFTDTAIWSLAIGIIFGLMCMLFTFLVQLIGLVSPPPRPRMGICNRCFKLTLDGRMETCGCGGTFEDADGWTLNRCPKCGYDLRASRERCPECGTCIDPASLL